PRTATSTTAPSRRPTSATCTSPDATVPRVIELRELTSAEHEVAERFWQLFLHDLSEFRNSHPDEHGAFKRRHLEPYLVANPDRAAFVVYASTGPVGLAFVYGLTGEVRRFDQF